MVAGRSWALVALVAAFALLGTFPSALAVSAASAAPPAVPESPFSIASSAPDPALSTSPAPPISCGGNYPGYYALDGNVWPLDPDFAYQGPCHLGAVDEVHGSFASGAAGSGERWSIPWTLPSQGSAGQENIEQGVYVGMVVSGDPTSTWNQSYLEVLATPIAGGGNASLSWTVQLAVLSFANMTAFDPVGCPLGAYNLSWNDSAFCEFDDLADGEPLAMLSDVAGGTALAVTFDGQTGATAGMNVWVNETNGPLNTSAVQLGDSETLTYAFEPAYSSACAGSCFLTWGLSYGLGVGIDLCPIGGSASAACDSYNGSAYSSLPPVTWGSPEFWNGTGYGDDYRYLQPESASGVCNTNPPVGVQTAPCFEFTGNGGDGFYPYFSLTGTGLAFGQTYPTSVTTYGGAYGQFLDTPGTQDLNPIVETDLSDSSLAGFVGPASGFNVSFNVTDLGSISSVTLAWSVNGSAWTTEPLAGTGTNSSRSYVGAIPSGANGPVRYQVNATNQAGLTVSSSVRSVLRGPLPSFTVTVAIAPPACGTVSIDGTPYGNGSTVVRGPGPVPISASGCYPYNFTSWKTTPSLTVGPGGAAGATLTVGGSGTLTAQYAYERPTLHLSVSVDPSGCGDVGIDGTSYANGSVAAVLYGLSHALNVTVLCGGYTFGGWSSSANVSVLGSSLVAVNNGSLTLDLVPVALTQWISFATSPVTCGGVGLAGAGYTTGESVNVYPGTYPLTPEPCAHFGFANFTFTGLNVSVSGSTLTVTGTDSTARNNTVTENNFALTEIYVATSPGLCGGIVLDGTTYLNGSYVPVENHSAYTVTAFSCAGHFLDAFSASGGLSLAGSLLTVNGSGTLLVVSLPGTASIFVGFVTTPAVCGGIELNGTYYVNGAFVSLAPFQHLSIQALPCAEYGIVGWAVTGEISIVGNEAYLNGSGAITAVFGALVSLLFETVPATCGATLIDGVPYADGTSATLINGRNYTIAPDPCAHYELQQFESSPYVAIENDSIAPDGPSTITAVFVLTPYAVGTTLVGPGCGSVTLEGVVVGTGDVFNLTAGSYPLTESPCSSSEFAGFAVGANLSVAAGRLYVNGSGSLTATFLPILPSVSLGGNSGSYVGGTALFYASVQVLVAASGYTYNWTFGDGTSNLTTANTTTHVFRSTGTFTVSVEVTDPFNHTANATLTVTVVAQPTTNYGATLTTGLVVLGIAAVVLIGVALIARRRAPPSPPDSGAIGSPGTTTTTTFGIPRAPPPRSRPPGGSGPRGPGT